MYIHVNTCIYMYIREYTCIYMYSIAPRKPPGHFRFNEEMIQRRDDSTKESFNEGKIRPTVEGKKIEKTKGTRIDWEMGRSIEFIQNPFKIGQKYTKIGPKLVPGGGKWGPRAPKWSPRGHEKTWIGLWERSGSFRERKSPENDLFLDGFLESFLVFFWMSVFF